MASVKFDNVRIAAVGAAVPDFVQSVNLDPSLPAAAYNANFSKQTGITQRHVSISEQTGVDLGYVAMRDALAQSGWQASSLDGLIFLTQTPDFNMATGNSFLLHKHLELKETAFAFDVAQGCAALPYGLSIAGAYLQQPGINRVALVMGDVMWPAYPGRNALLASPTFLTGDGVGCVLLEKTGTATADKAGAMDIELFSDGSGYHFLYNPFGGTRHAWRKAPGRLPNGEPYHGGGYMDGMEITAFSTMRVADDIKDFLAKRNLAIEDFDSVALHQANLQILKAMRRRLKISPDKCPINIDRFANTNGASVILALVDSYAGQKGTMKVLASAFGIGLSWGIASFTLDKDVIAPLNCTSHRFDEDFLAPLGADPTESERS